MERLCGICKEKAEIECICKLKSKDFCSEHFISHRKENPNIRHISQDIMQDDLENNEVCFMCNLNSPNMCCVCNQRVTLLCQDCVGIHSKIGVSHVLEPIEAAEFIRETQDFSSYFNRKTRVQKVIMHLNDFEEKIQNDKWKFKNGIDKVLGMVKETAANGVHAFEQIENGLAELKNKAQLAQFRQNLDLSDYIYQLIAEEDYNKFAKDLQDLQFFSVTSNFALLELAVSSNLSIKNMIPFYTEKRNQLKAYYEENQKTMPKVIESLFVAVLENRAKQQSSITILENFAETAISISMLLPYFQNLTSLDLSENHIMTQGAKLIASGIRNSHSLTDLSLGGNEILDEGCEFICECLPTLPNLENLFLYKNCLTCKSALILSQFLPCVAKLKLISLNQNSIGDEGIEYLCGVIKALPGLEAIGLQKNQITQKSSLNITKLILELEKLSDLSLDDNCIGDVGAKELLKIFPLIKGPLKLYLRNNEITEELEDLLKSAGEGKILVAISYKVY